MENFCLFSVGLPPKAPTGSNTIVRELRIPEYPRTWNAVVAAEALRVVVDKLVHIRRQVIDIGEHLGWLILLGLLLLGPLDAEQLGQDLDEEALHPRRHAMRDR